MRGSHVQFVWIAKDFRNPVSTSWDIRNLVVGFLPSTTILQVLHGCHWHMASNLPSLWHSHLRLQHLASSSFGQGRAPKHPRYVTMPRYIYIYIGWLLPFAGGRFTTPVMKHAKISVFKFPRNFAQPFLFIPAHSYGTHSSQVKLSGTNASFGAIEIFPLLQSFLYNCKAVSTDIMPGFLCNAAAARTCIRLYLDE